MVGGLGVGLKTKDPSSTFTLPDVKKPEDAKCKLKYADKDVVNLDRDYQTVNPEEIALREMVATATHSIVFSQQDLYGWCSKIQGPIKAVQPLGDLRLLDNLADRMIHGVKVRGEGLASDLWMFTPTAGEAGAGRGAEPVSSRLQSWRGRRRPAGCRAEAGSPVRHRSEGSCRPSCPATGHRTGTHRPPAGHRAAPRHHPRKSPADRRDPAPLRPAATMKHLTTGLKSELNESRAKTGEQVVDAGTPEAQDRTVGVLGITHGE